ncbi:phage T7 F exclusion suppressor FxsA [Anatilimnocola aggregata]|uniref:Phage T7 F exclusion suppressor FxsA n=1 Tax=Anatilimnocola aggregata TaxID=2528021 RepID=A0A517Y9W5_9BACT|nr:FxsA family protein [Anatilimnocola aggregata]QDU27008.1 phage T7 F exclusion suppressor FxsA [Anatilimnocola aggregata]
MFARIFLFLTILPIVELTLLLLLGRYTSVWTAVGFVLITGLIGTVLLRIQGVQAWRNVQNDLRAGKMPTASLVDGFLILLASTLLISPGVLTDFVGITLLIPWCRRWYGLLLLWYFHARVITTFTQGNEAAPSAAAIRRTEVIDSYVVETPQHND